MDDKLQPVLKKLCNMEELLQKKRRSSYCSGPGQSCQNVRNEKAQENETTKSGMCGNLFKIEKAETHLERTTGEGDFNFCSFQRRKQPKRPSKKDRVRRQKQIVRKAQEARNHYSRPRMRNTCVFKGECKRRSAGSKKATYISQADTLKLSHDQLVDKVLMRMTPRQFETRCTHNKVHFVLNEQDTCNPLWSQPATLML
jgi:hypothetical protein